MILLWIYALYIAVWLAAVFYAGRYGWRYTKSKTKTAAICVVVFLVMYWPPFGDLIPTLWAHKQYCEKEAGFKVLVTPEQWAAENPRVLEELVRTEQLTVKDHVALYNQRIGTSFEVLPTKILALHKNDGSVVDIETKKVLAKYIDFSVGYKNKSDGWVNKLKIWLNKDSCFSGRDEDYFFEQKRKYLSQFNNKGDIK